MVLPIRSLRFAIALSYCIAIPGLLLGQQPPATADAVASLDNDPVFRAWGENAEVYECGGCHYEKRSGPFAPKTDFCQLEEARIWLQNDKHAICRQRVEPLSRATIEQLRSEGKGTWLGESNLVSYRMCQLLGYDIGTEAGYAEFRDNCLTCHGGYVPGEPAGNFTREAKNQPGISCNYCHQEGENTTWIDQHRNVQNWRMMTPANKAQAGLRNLVDASSQAQLCSSCHIGDQQSGKFVSHAMYVAGHPPLPGFELQKFIAEMPAHWRDVKTTYQSLAEFPERDTYFATNYANQQADASVASSDTFWETRTMLVGAIQSAKQSIALLATESGAAKERHYWGDYALYDCAACHHELRLPSARQQRQTELTPGRPRLHEWPNPLLEVSLDLFAEGSDVASARRALSQAVNATPFGDPAQCLPAAGQLHNALQELEQAIARAPIDAALARQILKDLSQVPADALVNYLAAKQVIWAIQLVDRELAAYGQALNPAAREAIARLGQQGQQTLISTDLPSGRVGTLYAPFMESPQSQQSATGASFLAAELERLRQHDPRQLLSQLSNLQNLLD